MICDEALAALFKLAVKTVEFVVVLFSKYLEVSLVDVQKELIGCRLQVLITISNN